MKVSELKEGMTVGNHIIYYTILYYILLLLINSIP